MRSDYHGGIFGHFGARIRAPGQGITESEKMGKLKTDSFRLVVRTYGEVF